MKLEPESRKQLLRIAGGTAICTAAMWVLFAALHLVGCCLLYTSDAADE